MCKKYYFCINPYLSTNYKFYPMFTGRELHRSYLHMDLSVELALVRIEKNNVVNPLKTLWEMKKLLVTSNFSFSHSVLYPFGEVFTIFIKFKIAVCKLFSFEVSKICRLGKG